MSQPSEPRPVLCGAFLSDCRRYRFTLTRQWDDSKPLVAFIGVNPSTADETQDDATIRRCMGFARLWGNGGILMLNLYAYRATDPKDLWAARKRGIDILGGERNWVPALKQYVRDAKCDRVIAAWGRHGAKRGPEVAAHWQPGRLDCLQLTEDQKHPRHPLMLKSELYPMPFNYVASETSTHGGESISGHKVAVAPKGDNQ